MPATKTTRKATQTAKDSTRKAAGTAKEAGGKAAASVGDAAGSAKAGTAKEAGGKAAASVGDAAGSAKAGTAKAVDKVKGSSTKAVGGVRAKRKAKAGMVRDAREIAGEADAQSTAADAIAEAEAMHYQVEVNKRGLSVTALTKTLNQRWANGWRLAHVFEQRGNTVLVFEKRA